MANCIDVFDVIVVGAGVMGSSAAYQAAKRGKKTLLLEQFDFLHHRGSSHGESRTIRATYPEDYYPEMALESTKLWEEAEHEIGYKVYFKTSQFDMGPSDNKALQAVIASCHIRSIPVRILDHSQVNQEFLGKFQMPEDWIGVLTEHGGVIKPSKAVSMFQALAIKNGAILRDNTEVVDLKNNDRGGGVLVCTRDNEKFLGKKCIITVGAWVKDMVKNVSGLTLPIQPLETSVYYWKIKEGYEDEFKIQAGFPTFASYGEPYIYGTPSLEFPDLIKIAVHGGRPCEADKRTWVGAPSMVSALKQWIKGIFGDLVDQTGPVITQSCLYSMTPDEDFVVDFLGGNFERDVVVAGGFSGHGFKMAPIIGKILVDLVLGEEVERAELKYFKVSRFGNNGKGNAKKFSDQVNLDLPHGK